MTILKGKLINAENEPVPQASIKVINMTQSAISEDNGEYFIQFPTSVADATVTLDISKDGYKPAMQTASLKKEKSHALIHNTYKNIGGVLKTCYNYSEISLKENIAFQQKDGIEKILHPLRMAFYTEICNNNLLNK